MTNTKELISHELAIEILDDIAIVLDTTLYAYGIGKKDNLGAEFSLGRLVDDIQRMKSDNKEYYELRRILKKVVS